MRMTRCVGIVVFCAVAIAALALPGRAEPAPRGGTLDLAINNVSGLQQWGRTGTFPNGRLGLALGTLAFNPGDVNIPWLLGPIQANGSLDPAHPFIGQNLFRERDGRLEQIGLSWLKHAFFSLNDGCPDGSGNFLGIGCTDSYGAPTNQRYDLLAPRSEVNPFTGAWAPCGSHFDTGAIGYTVAGDCLRSHLFGDPSHGPLSHRLRVSEQDLLAADIIDGVDARLFIEAFYLCANDANLANNWGFRPIEAGPDPTWAFSDEAAFTQECIIFSWGDLQSLATPTDLGQVAVASRAVDLGGGAWRYEFNVYNLNRDGGATILSIPIASGANASNFGFNAPLEDEDTQFDDAAWTPAHAGGQVTFTAPTPRGVQAPNSIRFGTMYTFWFEADQAPADAAAQITWEGGAALTAAVIAPAAACPADITGDGVVNSSDLGQLLGAWGTSNPAADLTNDGNVNSSDLGQMLGSWGACP